MCGICGIYALNQENYVNDLTLKRMCQVLIHRGPDDEGMYIHGNIGLGMRRLSIIDLPGGRQPIHNEDETVWIVFNGEVYNYKDLRNNLEKKGHHFYTSTDTETIVHLYEEYGEGCVEYLNGMFAFAIWDARQRKLLLARDRLGIKPLYYWLNDEMIVFGSELKSILQHEEFQREIALEGLDLFLTFRYIPAPYSIFKGVKKLLAGHILVCAEGSTKIKQYWDVDFTIQNHHSESYYIERFLEIFQDAVKIRLMSDVPLGAFLSGGIDSSSVVAVMSRFVDGGAKTFSIGFEEGYYNELEYAQLIADKFKTQHYEFVLKPDIMDILSRYAWHFDEPFSDQAALPTFMLAQMTKEHVTVALTGDGGDEVFAGYERYWSEMMASYYMKVPGFVRNSAILPLLQVASSVVPASMRVKHYLEAAIKKTQLVALNSEERYVQHFYTFDEAQKQELYNPDILNSNLFPSGTALKQHFRNTDGYDELSKRLYVDLKTWLPEQMLTKIDRTTMAFSLEARVPFLDHRLVEFAATVPSHLKMNLWTLKALVKKAVVNLLPQTIIKRRKHGFQVPLNSWFRNELREYLQDNLSETMMRQHGLFNYPHVHQLLSEHANNKRDNSEKLFNLLVFQMWYAQFMTG